MVGGGSGRGLVGLIGPMGRMGRIGRMAVGWGGVGLEGRVHGGSCSCGAEVGGSYAVFVSVFGGDAGGESDGGVCSWVRVLLYAGVEHVSWGWRVVLYTNTLEKLKRELGRKRVRPGAVYFSPSSDVFQPVPEVLAMAYEVMAFLLSNGVGVAFLTKGEIPARHMALLAGDASLVRAQVGLTTLDERVLRVLEPCAPSPETHPEGLAEMAQCYLSHCVPAEERNLLGQHRRVHSTSYERPV